MATHISNKLARLIRERAYTAGALAKIEDRVQDVRLSLKDAQAERRKILRQLSKLDAEIVKARLDPDDIRAIVRTPRKTIFRHGSFTSELVTLVRDAGEPITTGAIIRHLTAKMGLPYSTPQERDRTRRMIVERLRVLSRKGAIQRLHDTDDNQEGVWHWVGL